ncbi:hypothetical protein K2173_022758 [Erythroxylum novogranatense]|uniref:Uncharacterized protein n=1 Tax=Erythroxylum novogranatense TaxID=1862640 RepID=A0AAV8SMJ6_9ROSI|nr:hypothetical protein K2173_022758 [Erythroxylum novogranatense]
MAGPLIIHSPTSPSINSHCSENIADIAARVVREIAGEDYQDVDDHGVFPWNRDLERRFLADRVEEISRRNNDNEEDEDEEEEEFEFAVVPREADGSPITADEIFYNGQIRPVYPLFNTDLLLEKEEQNSSKTTRNLNQMTTTTKSKRSKLKKLFDEEKDWSCSSSEAEELDGLPKGTYCVWAPRTVAEVRSPEKCDKSNSTGSSSKKWRLRDLVFGSSSERKDAFVLKRLVKRHSFLPYRQDLIFSSNGNRMVGRV